MCAAPADRTALVILVPEAEDTVGALRAAHDSSAALGVAAHVTILFPFVPVAAWNAHVDTRLAAVFSRHRAFDAEFRATSRFGDAVLYLAPEPAEAFSALTSAVAAEFQEHPPYEGAHAVVIPHLTVADQGGRAVLDALEASLRGMAPVRTRVREVTLLEERLGRWRARTRWPLSRGASR